MKDLELSLHCLSFFDNRGQGSELNEAEQIGKVSFADFYDNPSVYLELSDTVYVTLS